MDQLINELNSEIEAAIAIFYTHARTKDSYIETMRRVHGWSEAHAITKWYQELAQQNKKLTEAFSNLRDHVASQYPIEA